MEYRKVLCIYPYARELGPYGFSPPLGLECIAASLKNLVGQVTIIDMRFEKNVADFIDDRTDLICISKNWGFEEEFFSRILRELPDHIPVIVGGRDATENVTELFENHPNIRIVVRGDGEETIRELLEGGSPRDVAGLSYRQNGTLVHNEARYFSGVSDSIYPDRRLRRYTYKVAPEGFDLGMQIDTVSSSRGCPFKCKFCTFNMTPHGAKREWASRTPESVVREIKHIDADLIVFVDDNFTHDMDRVRRICNLILQEGIKKKFIANARIDIARHPDVLARMEKAGFKFLLLGIESACDKTLKFLNKGFTVAKVREAFRVLRKFNILYHGYFIVGNIGEDEKDMLSIAEFAREIGVDTLTLNRLRVDKYSPLRTVIENLKDYHIGDGGEVYSDRYPAEKLGEIGRNINRRFYTLPHTLRLLRKLLSSKTITIKLVYSLMHWIRYIKARETWQASARSFRMRTLDMIKNSKAVVEQWVKGRIGILNRDSV